MLKIYHLHEKVVDYEEYIDRIIESSFIKEKLEEKINELESKFIKNDKDCNECPLYFCKINCDDDCEKCSNLRVAEVKDFCKSYVPFEEDSTSCKNFNISDRNINYFIEEKEIDISLEELMKLIY